MRPGTALAIALLAPGVLSLGCGRLGFTLRDAGLAADASSGPDGGLDGGLAIDASRPTDAGDDAGRIPDPDGGNDGGNDAGNDARVCATVLTDADGDGFGSDATARFLCEPLPAGVTTVGGDCDDRDASTSPDSAEVCDGRDEDCDDVVDDGACDGSVVRVVVTGLLKTEAWRRIDLDPSGRLVVLGGTPSGTSAVELRAADGSLVATHGTTAGAHAEQWVRALSDGWVLGAPSYLQRYDSTGGLTWERTFVSGGGAAWAQYAPAADDDQIVIAGEQLGAIDVGTGSLPWNSTITSLVAAYDPATGMPRYVRRNQGAATRAVALTLGGAFTSGFFALAPIDLGDGIAVVRPLFVARHGADGGLTAEWRSLRSPSGDEAVLGLEELPGGDVVLAADYDGGDFEGTVHPAGRSALVARFTWTTGAVRWSRAFPASAHTNDIVMMDSGGRLVCLDFMLDVGPTDWGDGVMTSAAGSTVVCLDAATGTTRFAFPNPGGREVAVGPTGLVYTAGPAGLGSLIEITIRR